MAAEAVPVTDPGKAVPAPAVEVAALPSGEPPGGAVRAGGAAGIYWAWEAVSSRVIHYTEHPVMHRFHLC